MVTKTCTKCGQTFPATTEYFYRSSRRVDGFHVWCKTCFVVYARVYRDTHKEKIATNGCAYRETHRKEEVARVRAYRESHKAQTVATQRVWTQQNWEYVKEYNRNRFWMSPKLRLNRALAVAIEKSLHGCKAGHSWKTLVGYTLDDLMCHLEAHFQPGMSWENYGEWQIDHIRPRSSFRFVSRDEFAFKECWALTNLQPLWVKDNLHKAAKWSEEITA